MKRVRKICLVLLTAGAILQACKGIQPEIKEIQGVWENSDGAQIILKKDGTFSAKLLPADIIIINTSEYKNKRFSCTGNWIIKEANDSGDQLPWSVTLHCDHSIGINYTGPLLLSISGSNYLENKPPWKYLFVWNGEEGGNRYKFLKRKSFYDSAQYPSMIRIYNYRSELLDISIEELQNKELILCPLLIAGILPTLSKGIWKIINNEGYSVEEIEIPNYKRAEPDEENAIDWYYLENANISKKIKSTYENVMHLETIGAKGAELVGTKIAMALIRDEGKEVRTYFKLEEYFEKQYYKEVMEIPAYYKQPKLIQGKAIKE